MDELAALVRHYFLTHDDYPDVISVRDVIVHSFYQRTHLPNLIDFVGMWMCFAFSSKSISTTRLSMVCFVLILKHS